jgi:hypothetical protein
MSVGPDELEARLQKEMLRFQATNSDSDEDPDDAMGWEDEEDSEDDVADPRQDENKPPSKASTKAADPVSSSRKQSHGARSGIAETPRILREVNNFLSSESGVDGVKAPRLVLFFFFPVGAFVEGENH